MRSQQCIFCPKPADSKEHIWSKWILELLPKAENGIFTRVDSDGKVHSRKARKPDVSAKVVCEKDCNNGWMSTRLEGPMKAITSDIILTNKQKVFSPQDCAAIAAWAFKTTILANHMPLRGEPFFPESERHAFARDLSIPAGVSVWIAQRNAGYLTATYRSIQRVQQPRGQLTPHLIRPPESPYMFKTYTCTFVIGFLLLQVVSARWAKREVSDRLNFPAVVQPEISEQYAATIWPNKGLSVSWPPPQAIGNAFFDKFWDRFETLNLPSWMG